MSPDSEAELNRLLTEQRGLLYRVGSDLERRLTDLTIDQAGLGALVTVVTEVSGLPLLVRDAQGRTLAAAGDWSQAPSSEHGAAARQAARHLPLAAELVIGPLRPEQQIVARFLTDRVAGAAGAALQRDHAGRPRGSRRAQAIEALLSESPTRGSELRAAALRLGLDPDGWFVVAAYKSENEPEATRILASLGEVHPTAVRNGVLVSLVAAPSQVTVGTMTNRMAEVKQRWASAHVGVSAMLALSAPASGVLGLPGAAMEARFIAAWQARTRPSRIAASFDSVDDLGVLRLLYAWRDSRELQDFSVDVLGSLLQHDRRGLLRATLEAYLETGGSHADASRRLGIHRNTLAYRLHRIGTLVGRDVTDPAWWLPLHLALRVREMQEAHAPIDP
jgi:hypothetical protein